MQTFLPFPDFVKSAESLDMKRLGKQRVETLQLLKAINGFDSRWANHPACKMWKYHPDALIAYGVAICAQWRAIGYSDTCLEKIIAYGSEDVVFEQEWLAQHDMLPSWLGDPDFHQSHRSNLIRKLPKYYRIFLGWDDPDNLEYIWPK